MDIGSSSSHANSHRGNPPLDDAQRDPPHWTPLLIGGALVALLILKASPLKRLPGNQPRRPRPHPPHSLAALRQAMIGSPKRSIASIFGRPRAVIGRSLNPVEAANFWSADIWYYPLDRRRHLAVAISFIADRAESVEFIPMSDEP